MEDEPKPGFTVCMLKMAKSAKMFLCSYPGFLDLTEDLSGEEAGAVRRGRQGGPRRTGSRPGTHDQPLHLHLQSYGRGLNNNIYTHFSQFEIIIESVSKKEKLETSSVGRNLKCIYHLGNVFSQRKISLNLKIRFFWKAIHSLSLGVK